MTLATPNSTLDTAAIDRAIDAACARIAPTWPLDQFIAVNPFWGAIEQPLPQVAAKLAALCGSRLLMPRAWYRGEWQSGRLREEHLAEAIAVAGAGCQVADLLGVLRSDAAPLARRALVTDVVDAGRDIGHAMAWTDYVTMSLGQYCAAYFDEGQAQLGPDRVGGLYPSWLRHAHEDRGPTLLMQLRHWQPVLRALPSSPRALITAALETLAVPAEQRESYLWALLQSLNGWAAWCAYLRWQARLAGSDDDQIEHLLALRLAWDWLLFETAGGADLGGRWRQAMKAWPQIERGAGESQSLDWLLQRALEIAYQTPLSGALAEAVATVTPAATVPDVQAAFCIDVRSEVFRRALEGVTPRVATLGFAGFFGLPIDYQPVGAVDARPQLPGLLAPSLRVVDTGARGGLAGRRADRLGTGSAWKQFKLAAVSAFSFVEALGLYYGSKLVTDSLGRTAPVANAESAGLTAAEYTELKPRIAGPVTGGELTLAARADLAAGILRAMSLARGYARLVLLAGHGSETVNNPHAAGLDCGACCGQTGEVNARAVVGLLNDPEVRVALRERGIDVPDTTRFIAGLHNTTVDEVRLFDLDELPDSHRDDLATLVSWLDAAGSRARAERAASLGLASLGGQSLRSAVAGRARDWSEVRPEWGLANCAAFIVAPRALSRGINLAGRSFLHDYTFEDDLEFGVLELIMTAPMVVTHWINMQYYASTVDNLRYGSGNKVLHNVVGGRIGVFEGNGGDLRIGLPMQSLHDGQRYMHTPLRLSVFIRAPQEAMDRILEKHAHVRSLVENEWLYLFQIAPDAPAVHARRADGWHEVARHATA